jgi:hypothetical protein
VERTTTRMGWGALTGPLGLLVMACSAPGGETTGAGSSGAEETRGADEVGSTGVVATSTAADATTEATTVPPGTSTTNHGSEGVDDTTTGEPPSGTGGIWISVEEVMALPTSGPAWERVLAVAMQDPGAPNLSDQDQDHNVMVLAKALVCVRLDDAARCDEVRAAVMDAIETENGGRTLALGRELLAYVVAADLVGLPETDDAIFRAWLADVIHEELEGRTLVTTHEDRPNNWGTHAGASRVAVAVYLDDEAEIDRCAVVFRGWLGDRDAYAGFAYGESWWQSDPRNPVGINPMGATIMGQNVDGVLPDDQRRAGPFAWPPPQENYVYEALQGSIAQAVILHRLGYDVWSWQDQALLRAYLWLHQQASYPAAGDDTWQMHLVNHYYGTSLPAPELAAPGKNIGWTDWTHAAPAP